MPNAITAEFPEKLQCLFGDKRFIVLYGGRGAGRSWGVARSLLLSGVKSPTHVLCARELQNSIDESVHKLLSDQIVKKPPKGLGLENFYKIEKAKIYGPVGTEFSFVGIKNNANKVRSYEGIDYCWVEEGNKVSKNSWGILLPTIRKKGSKIIITFNPELDTDYTYRRFVKDLLAVARPVKNSAGETLWLETDDTVICKMTWRDNHWFESDTELKGDMEKDKERDIDSYLNVWEGHTVQQLEGAVYAKELRAATLQSRICTVPYDRQTPVDTYWDLGRADNTAIWFIQRVAMQFRVLAYYEERGFDITHYLKECQRRGYLYGTMHLPHDGKAKVLGTKHSIEETMRNAGYRVSIVPKLSVADGISAARAILPNCYFDEEECEDGISALRHYRYRILPPSATSHVSQYSNEPLHDWASDGADAFRAFAVAIRSPSKKVSALSRLLTRKSSVYVEKAPHLGWMS